MICVNKKCLSEIPDNSDFCPRCGRRQLKAPKKHIKRPNGSGTVYKLSGRRRRPWVAAKSGIVIGYYETKTEAQEMLVEVAKKPITERFNMTFKDVFEAWKLEHFRRLTDKGIEGYELAYKHFSNLHDCKFRDLRTEHFQKEVDAFVAKGRSHSSANKLKQLIGQLSKYAIREEIMSANYSPYIILPENKKKDKKTFTEADIKKLKASRDDAAKIVLMLIYTGMRIGELFNLQTKDVFPTYCIGGEKTEAGRNRIIPISPDGRKYFDYFMKKAGESKLLIDGYGGNRDIDNFRNRDYYGLLENLQIEKKNPHCTRHTFTSMAVRAGMRPEILQKILGHASYTTTSDVYVHADIESLVIAVEALQKKRKSSGY